MAGSVRVDAMAAVDEQVRLEYDRAVATFRDLTDIRFRLLALVPTLSGAAVGLLRSGQSPVTLPGARSTPWMPATREVGVVIGAVAGLAVLLETLRLDGRD